MAGKVSKNMAIGAGVIGFILIACGLGCCVAGFVFTAYGKSAMGIWSGIFMLIVGVLGVVIVITKNKGVMIVFLVGCIIDLIINIIQAIIAAILAALVGILERAMDEGNCQDVPNSKGCYCTYTEDASGLSTSGLEIDNCDDITAMMAILRAVTAFSVIGIIATFAGSIIGCVGACCDKGDDQPGVVIIQQGMPQQQTTTVQTFQHQPPPPNQQYPMGATGYPDPEQGNPGYMGQPNAGY